MVEQLKRPQKIGFDNYYAVAYRADASDVWIMGGATRRDAAERDARLLCAFNNVSSFARGMDGDFYFAQGSTLEQSDSAVLASCRSNKDFCTVFRRWVANPALVTWYRRGVANLSRLNGKGVRCGDGPQVRR